MLEASAGLDHNPRCVGAKIMTTADPNGVRLPLEVRVDISQRITEIHIAAAAAAVGLETANQLLGQPGELVSVFTHLQALADGAADLAGLWSDLLTLADGGVQ
jgi:hypothetical protein